MTRLFRRRVTLTVAKFEPDSFFTLKSNAVVIRDLRVAFQIQRSLEAQPNSATVVVSNLAERTRAAFQEKPLNVRLDVGFDEDADEARLFTGDVIYSNSRRVTADWETNLQLGDGHRAHRHARANRSFRGGVNLKDAIRETAKSMGLSVPTSVEEASDLIGKLNAGVSLDGPSEAQMTRLLNPSGRSWSIQDGKLQILGGREVRQDEAVLVSQDTGMIGNPESGAPKNPREPSILTVSTLLDPRLIPGVKMRVESQQISGLFRVEKVSHNGDTHGAQWTSKVEGEPL